MRRRSPRVHGRGRPGLLSACRLDLVVATVSTARPAPPRWRCCNAALPSPPSRRLPRQPRHAGQARPRTAFCSRTSDCGDWHRLVLVVPRPQAPCTDGEDIGRGVSDRPLARRTSSLCKVAWAPCLMWDERASSLRTRSVCHSRIATRWEPPVSMPSSDCLPMVSDVMPGEPRKVSANAPMSSSR